MALNWCTETPDGLVVHVRVQPGARRSEVGDVVDGRLRVRVAAPAIDGKANEATIGVLAAHFGVRPRAVTLVRGDRSREKTFVIAGARPPAAP